MPLKPAFRVATQAIIRVLSDTQNPNGLTQRQIVSKIEQTYRSLPNDLTAKVTKGLTRLKKANRIIKIGWGRYGLPLNNSNDSDSDYINEEKQSIQRNRNANNNVCFANGKYT